MVMCGACVTCPKCGQTAYQRPNLRYMVGLLTPFCIMIFILAVEHRYLDVLDYHIWFAGYILALGFVAIVTDPHVRVWKDGTDVGGPEWDD